LKLSIERWFQLPQKDQAIVQGGHEHQAPISRCLFLSLQTPQAVDIHQSVAKFTFNQVEVK
jgi:hypothetical protein